MYFTNGDHQAFESLMRDKSGDHYDPATTMTAARTARSRSAGAAAATDHTARIGTASMPSVPTPQAA